MLRIVVIADEDSRVGERADGEADLLISCGDLWDGTILKARDAYGGLSAFAVRDNHDPDAPFPTGIDDLHLTVRMFAGLRFGGFRGCWRYKPRGHHLWDQSEVASLLGDFPPVDVFVAHNSPRGVHECDEHVHQGFDAFLAYIERARPRYVLHGHQHLNLETRLAETRIVGVYGQRWITIEEGVGR